MKPTILAFMRTATMASHSTTFTRLPMPRPAGLPQIYLGESFGMRALRWNKGMQ